MELSLQDILGLGSFRDFRVLAGKNGLDRAVTSVSVMDAPDISDWLKGGEILMTTGYLMKNDTSQFVSLIRSIDRANAAALFIKIHRFIDSLPREVYETAEELNFPVVSMPIGLAFTDVINPVLSLLVNEQAKRLEISEKIHRSFTSLVLNGGTFDEIIATLGKIMEKDVAFLDTGSRTRYIAAVSDYFEADMKNETVESILSRYKSYPVRIDKKNYGYIIYSDRDSSGRMNEYNGIAVEHAGTVLKLEIQKRISNLEIENRHKNEFVQDILLDNFKNPEEIRTRAGLYGWSYGRGLNAVVVAVDDRKESGPAAGNTAGLRILEKLRESAFSLCKDVMKRSFGSVIHMNLSDEITFLAELPENTDTDGFYSLLSRAVHEMHNTVREKIGLEISAGVGDYVESVMQAHLSYREAKSALKLGRQIRRQGEASFYRDLGVYRLLGTIYRSSEARSFCNSSIGILREHDLQNGTDFLKTLVCIKECNWNLKSAAEKLFVHYNTIKYRYKKIESLLDVNLEDSEARFAVSMSIKLSRMVD